MEILNKFIYNFTVYKVTKSYSCLLVDKYYISANELKVKDCITLYKSATFKVICFIDLIKRS